MSTEYIQVDLSKAEKSTVIDLALFVISDEVTIKDLQNNRKKWIRFDLYELTAVIGEIAYNLNNKANDYEVMFYDELISHLEYYEKQ
jgi:hypothetical protein